MIFPAAPRRGASAPIPKTELTDEAEDAIAEYLDEFRVGGRAAIVLGLPEGELAGASPYLLVRPSSTTSGFDSTI